VCVCVINGTGCVALPY